MDGKNDIDATITFYDTEGHELGDARIHADEIGGPLASDIHDPIGISVSFIAKGDVTNYQTFGVKVNTITPSKNKK